MKLLLRVLFYTVLVYASYQLLAGLMQKKPQLPKVLQDYADNAMQQYLCKAPVSWRIGQLDPAFDLTLEQAEQAAHSAAMQWNQAFGLELFRYDSIDGFAINFAYDERQQQVLQQALLQRLDHHRRRGEIHVGDPHRQHIGRVTTPLGAASVVTVEHLIKIESHAHLIKGRGQFGRHHKRQCLRGRGRCSRCGFRAARTGPDVYAGQTIP